MYYCFFAQTGDYTKTNAADMNSQITGLLANIESLIEAAQAVQYVSSSTTRKVLKTSVALKDKMRKYKHDLERGIGGSEDNIGIDRPSVIYPRTFKSIMKRTKQSCSDLRNLESEVEAISLMKTEEEKPAETKQKTTPAKALSKELEKPEVGTQAYPGPRRQVPTSDADRQRAFLGGYTVGEYKYAPDLPRGETATKQDTAPSKHQRIWTCVKKIPRWIYYLVGFLAMLLTCIYFLWWLWTQFLA